MTKRFMYPRARRLLKINLFEQQSGQCCYCGRAVDLHPSPWATGERTPDHFATIEHLRRIADGGTNDPDNLAIACFACNGSRGAMNWVAFKTLMSMRAA